VGVRQVHMVVVIGVGKMAKIPMEVRCASMLLWVSCVMGDVLCCTKVTALHGVYSNRFPSINWAFSLQVSVQQYKTLKNTKLLTLFESFTLTK
jgi:hypothetical protein